MAQFTLHAYGEMIPRTIELSQGRAGSALVLVLRPSASRPRRTRSRTGDQRAKLVQDTPLWFYLLREAEFNGGKLSDVGARIVAETFHRAMQGSKFSIVRDKTFRPTLGLNNTTFRMVDLLLFAFEGQAALLNPLGD